MLLSKEERAEIDAAADRSGMKAATFARVKALEAARALALGDGER